MEEMRLAINRRVCDSQKRFRVIPVLLPGAKRDSLPALLVNTTWGFFQQRYVKRHAIYHKPDIGY
jgi:hypothetical protein